MKQLSDTEKQELETKIKDEQERQQTLGEIYPNTPKDSKETSAKTGFTSSYLWKYGLLAFILALLAWSVFILFKFRNFGYDNYGGLMVGLMLLFNHIAYYFTTKGWKSVMTKTVAWVWIVLVFVYLFWIT